VARGGSHAKYNFTSTQRSLTPAVGSNSCRFLLPAELILQIISHLGNDRCRGIPYHKGAFPLYFERQAALRALSQTSRLLKSVCLPILWEYLDVYCYRSFNDSAEFFRHKLARITSGLIGNPMGPLWQHWSLKRSDLRPCAASRVVCNDLMLDSFALNRATMSTLFFF
jgi:hypothetical protein